MSPETLVVMDADVIVVDECVQELNLAVLLLVEDVHRLREVPQLLVKLVGVLFVQGRQGLVVGAHGGRGERGLEGVRHRRDVRHGAYHHGGGRHCLEHDQNMNRGCALQYPVICMFMSPRVSFIMA